MVKRELLFPRPSREAECEGRRPVRARVLNAQGAHLGNEILQLVGSHPCSDWSIQARNISRQRRTEVSVAHLVLLFHFLK